MPRLNSEDERFKIKFPKPTPTAQARITTLLIAAALIAAALGDTPIHAY